MEKLRIGAVTVGQSPRTDIMADAQRFFYDQVDIIEFGALDRYSLTEAEALLPVPGDYQLTSRLRNGKEVKISRSQVIGELKRGISSLEEQGVTLIMVLCTGQLEGLCGTVPILEPNLLVKKAVVQMTKKQHILTLSPSEQQILQSERRWKESFPDLSFTSFGLSPYSSSVQFESVLEKIEQIQDADLLIMDCLGFSFEMYDRLRKATEKKVLLPRRLLFETAAELLGIR